MIRFLPLTLFFCSLIDFSAKPTVAEQPANASSSSNIHTVGAPDDDPRATNILLQSADGGQTWQDVSKGLPDSSEPEDFFAGKTEIYMRVKGEMYRSKANLPTPVWVKEGAAFLRNASIAFNPSGVMAFKNGGAIYGKTMNGNWAPILEEVKDHSMRTIFECEDGTVFLGYDNGLFKSTDKGLHWKHVHQEGWVIEMVESEGVILATGQKGIMRSTDKGEHWQWVISEGGVGIAVERIDGGFAAISYNTTMKSRRIHISLDKGATWKAVDEGLALSPNISSIKQMGPYLICGHPDGIYRSADKGKTWDWVHAGADYKFHLPFTPVENSKVFRIYVAGNVLYAVKQNWG